MKSKASLSLKIMPPPPRRTTALVALSLFAIFSRIESGGSLRREVADEEWDGQQPRLERRLYLNGNINVSGGPTVFDVDYKPGCAYGLSVKMDLASKIDVGVGSLVEQNLHTETRSKMAVSQSNDPADGRLIEIEVEAVKVNMDFMGQSTSYDSDDTKNSKPVSGLDVIKAMVGTTKEIVLDSDGEVVAITEDEELLNFLEETGGRRGQVEKLAMSNSFQQMVRITEAVAFDSVLPGDAWEFDDLQLDSSILYDGQGDYLGKISHEGRQLHVITLEGNSQELIDDVGNVKEGAMIKQARITATIYWDTDKKFIRWADVTQHMALLTKSTLDETKKMEIPVNQIMKISIDMECPESGNSSL